MFIIHLCLALAGTATIMAAPQNITMAINTISGNTSTTSNFTSSTKDSVKLATTTSNHTSPDKDFLKTAATSSRCGIHLIQYRDQKGYPTKYIELSFQDWNNKTVIGKGSCVTSICSWPLHGLGDMLVSLEVEEDVFAFYREGTVSNDSWNSTDADKRCQRGKFDPKKGAGMAQMDCGFACDPYKYGI